MKKWGLLILFLILSACSGEENVTNTTPENNVASDQGTNAEQPEPLESSEQPEDTEEVVEDNGIEDEYDFSDELAQYIRQLYDWQSFKSSLSYLVNYGGDEIDIEQYVDTQSIDSSNQVFVTSHYIGFQVDHSEHFANRDIGGYENFRMNGWEEIDDYEHILKPSLPAKAEFLLQAIESAEWMSKDDEFYQINIELRKEELQPMFEKLHTSIFYKATESEITDEMLELIRMEKLNLEYGFIGLKIGEHIIEYIAEFDFYDENGELGKITLKDEFTDVNMLDATDIPEGLF